ncbi:MAG: IS1182 family transposase, partial [Euryarchaeota archaeon]|nr:IS1182 family transposase [Euryarchaeota archaeon]
FYHQINLEQKVPKNHLLRKIQEQIDFDFIYHEVKDYYGDNGNVSIPPPVILKMMLLLILYNVRSERELMDTIPLRLDWLWFLGYDLDNEVPDHSVLSKARARWGVEAFRDFFERIVWQCVEAGLVDGRKIFVDSSLVDADASNNSVIDTQSLKIQLRENYQKLEARLEKPNESLDSSRRYVKQNSRYRSTTDPDSAIVNRGKPKLSYQVHRAVDGRSEIITATETTAGDVNEAHRMIPLLESHHANTGRMAEGVVGDSKYGTIENYLACRDRGVEAHIPDLGECSAKRAKKRKIFLEERFEYDPQSDTYRCPAGNRLRPKSLHKGRESRDYAASKKVCAVCDLRKQCTKNKSGRTIKRHLRQEELDKVREASRSRRARRDIKIRQHLMERSYARGTRYGFDRARWRGLWRVQIQEYLIAAIQNIEVLLRYGEQPKKSLLVKVRQAKGEIKGVIKPIWGKIKDLMDMQASEMMSLDFVRVGFNEN